MPRKTLALVTALLLGAATTTGAVAGGVYHVGYGGFRYGGGYHVGHVRYGYRGYADYRVYAGYRVYADYPGYAGYRGYADGGFPYSALRPRSGDQ